MGSSMIDCHLHDYIEIACLYKLDVTLILKDNTRVVGVAQDTWAEHKQEYFRLHQEAGDKNILLTDLKQMIAINKNAYFDVIDFV